MSGLAATDFGEPFFGKFLFTVIVLARRLTEKKSYFVLFEMATPKVGLWLQVK